MKNIQNAQSSLVNDTCTDCGSYADIGAVIDEHDRQLVVHFTGPQAQAESELLTQKVKARFEDVNVGSVSQDSGISLTINFSFSAEKMIFQLENSF
ncbi:DUF406 family protein [Shewanella violacea]|uniref:DUF406 family protein n=1 Tax=Shewanella violacea (strain JCM 10179 / CIP 106290 / LMG 19151 / DSS12) TaxID=637905 RepID=D4ZKU9_SHEVD|nr:DUF406 family protein [Shewanella violacea]BAJ02298.1 conserved hypothetical protein [Shewanella violacea DSS12]